jgi:2,3-bisphosphoglycerate-independent phosphoglycerate mutase
MEAVRESFNSEVLQFYSGTSYRHITVWKQGEILEFEQPHDHLGEVIGPFLPTNRTFHEMMEKSFEILNDHPLNQKRAADGKNKANSLWFWGAGTKPALSAFEEKTGLKGTMISAVDLLKGIGVGTGMDVPLVEGANGGLHTNYEGKAQAAIDALLGGMDFAYIHVEAPDEMGHQGLVAEKIQAIENLDSRVIAPVKAAMEAAGEDYRMLIVPDHATPIAIRTHNCDFVPFILFDSRRQSRRLCRFSEKEAAATGITEPKGHRLINRLLEED